MTIHLFQFRFGDTQDYYIRVPPYMINWLGIFSLNLFWDYDKSLPLMGVRDIYQLEFDLFQSAGWVAFSMASGTECGTQLDADLCATLNAHRNELIKAHPENPPPEYLQCPPKKHIHSK